MLKHIFIILCGNHFDEFDGATKKFALTPDGQGQMVWTARKIKDITGIIPTAVICEDTPWSKQSAQIIAQEFETAASVRTQLSFTLKQHADETLEIIKSLGKLLPTIIILPSDNGLFELPPYLMWQLFRQQMVHQKVNSGFWMIDCLGQTIDRVPWFNLKI